MSKIAVIGATGTAGSRTAAKLKAADETVVKISRSTGVDVVSGDGLLAALEGVDVAIDASNPVPADDGLDIREVIAAATRNVIGACAAQQVRRLVFLTICGIDDPVFDDFPYYVGKRIQAEIVRDSGTPSTAVRSTQWHEFAINPAAVTFEKDNVSVQDWLIQPIAVDTVADVLVQAATNSTSAPRTITGPEVIRLPQLTTELLARSGDTRPVRVTEPPLAALAEGALLAPADAAVIGPDVASWLDTDAVPIGKWVAWRTPGFDPWG